MAIEEGKKAPAFTLPDENSDKVKLSGLTGQWIVLYFYPRDDTPGCTIEACSFRDNIDQLTTRGVDVFGVMVLMVDLLDILNETTKLSVEIH